MWASATRITPHLGAGPAELADALYAASAAILLADYNADRQDYGVRDQCGNRPLCLGKIVPLNLDSGKVLADGWIVFSESCGFLSIGARYMREVEPGEIVELTRNGFRTINIITPPALKRMAFCIFEYVYFTRGDSIFEGQMVYSVRMQCGRHLAREALIQADIVSSVPESGSAAAHGYARQSGLEFAEVLCKNWYVGVLVEINKSIHSSKNTDKANHLAAAKKRRCRRETTIGTASIDYIYEAALDFSPFAMDDDDIVMPPLDGGAEHPFAIGYEAIDEEMAAVPVQEAAIAQPVQYGCNIRLSPLSSRARFCVFENALSNSFIS